MAKNRAVFLDRDGTINEDTGYAHRGEQYRLLPGVIEGLKVLRSLGFKLIVVTAQSGVGRGLFTEEDVHSFHDKISKDIEKHGLHMDAFYFCPHHPTEAKGKYLADCDCRKPKTGMIDAASRAYDIDPKTSYVIGDSDRDIEMGKRAGCATILVKTGTHKNPENASADYIAHSLHDAAAWIAKKEGTR